MGNIADYVDWRGDLSFKTSPFNHIDSLILCQLLYAYLEDVIPAGFSSGITVSKAAERYVELGRVGMDLGILINKKTSDLFVAMGESRRFSQIRLCGFVNDVDVKQEKQFAAFTAILPDGMVCVVYRGTDDTLIGWKEDFNMAFLTPVPSQRHSIEYLEDVALHCRGKILLMGHSKGGNLAAYAASFCQKKTAQRICEVFNNDGPGFMSEVVAEPGFIAMTKKIRAVIPYSSIVGVLLQHPYDFTIVASSKTNDIIQHDIFSWQVKGTEFVTVLKRSRESLFREKTVKTWLEAVEHEKRKEFVNALFSVLDATGAKTLSELNSNWVKNSAMVIKNMHEMEKETRDNIFKIIKIFFHSIKVNIPPIKELF